MDIRPSPTTDVLVCTYVYNTVRVTLRRAGSSVITETCHYVPAGGLISSFRRTIQYRKASQKQTALQVSFYLKL